MAEVDHALKVKKSSSTTRSQASRKPRSKTGSKATKRAGTKARAKKVKETNGAEVDSKNGAELLRAAANREVVAQSETIAKGLTTKAIHGNTACTKMLVELIEGIKPGERPRNAEDLLSEAQRLALEPEWKGELEEGYGEIGEGGVETEQM